MVEIKRGAILFAVGVVVIYLGAVSLAAAYYVVARTMGIL